MPGRISNSTLPTVPNASPPDSYTVRPGDSLSAIARQHGVTLQAMIEANKGRYPSLVSNPGAINIGWMLSIPGGSAPATTPSPEARQPASNNNILMVGMNQYARDEAQKLRERGNTVTFIGDSFANDQIRARDAQGRTRTWDLRTDAGVLEYALSFGLSAEQTQQVADAIKLVSADGRDEFGQLAAEFARAERGGTLPSRLVLSGHHVGYGVYGDDNGTLRWEAFEKLTQALPRAARQVEDLHIAGCYSGGEPMMDRFRAMFPNVKTIWAYTGSAPGSWSGAMSHQRAWDTATRGSRTDLDRDVAARMRKGENVAVWTITHGYSDGRAPAELSEVRASYDRISSAYDRFFSGQSTVPNPQSGPLRDFYNDLQRLLQHPALPASERPALEARRDTAIRLLYYSTNIAPKFSTHHEGAIRAGFESMGMNLPDFATMSRAEALRTIASFESAVRSASPAPEAARRLLPLLTEGLRDLRSSRIPDAWV